MKKTLSLLAVLMVAGIATTPAQAATHYVSGIGGISWMNNVKYSAVYQQYNDPANQYNDATGGGGNNFSSNFDLGSGLTLLGAVGCDYGSYRLEAEVGYQTNDVKSAADSWDGIPVTYYADAAGTRLARYPIRGDVSVLSLMGNGYYDFDLGHKIELYAMAGVGVAQLSCHNMNWTEDWQQDNESGPYILTSNNDPGFNAHETTLAWQVGAGLAAPIADHVKLDLRYRYFATTDFTLTDSGQSYEGDTFTGFYSNNTSLSSHSVLLGLRVDF